MKFSAPLIFLSAVLVATAPAEARQSHRSKSGHSGAHHGAQRDGHHGARHTGGHSRRAVAPARAAAAAPAAAPAETLSQALETALADNPGLLSARSEVEAARQALPLAWADALPQINGNINVNHVDRSERTFSPLVREQREYWVSSVNTSWLIFGSGRIAGATHQARAQIATAVARYNLSRQELVLSVARAYAGVLLARDVRSAQARALENLQEQQRYVEANNRAGFLTSTDTAQARARVEQARASLAIADAQLQESHESYARLVGHPPGALETPPPLAGLPATLDAAVARALEENPAVIAAAANVDASDAAVDFAKASGRIRVFVDSNNGVFKQMNSETGRRQTEDIVSLRIAVPIFAGGATRARERQQRAVRNAARYTLMDTERETHQKVAAAWANVTAAELNVAAQSARVEATELAQRGMQREQLAGLRATIDVLNQEQELLAARVDLARARRDEAITRYELGAAIGALDASGALQAPASPP